MENMSRVAYFGNIFHSISFTESQIILDGFIAVENGKVIEFYIFYLPPIHDLICIILSSDYSDWQ